MSDVVEVPDASEVARRIVNGRLNVSDAELAILRYFEARREMILAKADAALAAKEAETATAVAAEREACAKVALNADHGERHPRAKDANCTIAALIRARGEDRK